MKLGKMLSGWSRVNSESIYLKKEVPHENMVTV